MIERAAYLAEILATPYDKATANCWWLACKVERDLFGRVLPTAPAAYLDRHERARVIAAHPARADWQQVQHPADGDLVLMARMPGKDIHCGVYLGDVRRIIHTDAPHGVVLDAPLDLQQARGWRITFYRPL